MTLVCALALAACDTASSSTIGSTATPPVELTTTSLRTEPGGSSDDPTTTVAADTTTTPEPVPETPFVGGAEPIFGPRTFDWAANFVVPGPIVSHDGLHYMFYTGHSIERPNITRGQIGVASSADGSDWAFLNDQPLLDGTSVEWSEGGIYPTSVLILDDGTWAMWFSVVSRAFNWRAITIGRATAPGPDGPWTADPEPVLVGGGEGTWNEKGVSHPSVVRVGEEYWMYFDGHIDNLDSERDRAIGLAYSTDGENWLLHDDPDTGGLYAASDPVFRPAPADEWDGARVMAPSVLTTDDGFVMVYQTSKRRSDRPGFLQDLGYATSTDGIEWTRGTNDPILKNAGTIAFVTNQSIAHIGDKLYLYYDAGGFMGASSNAVFMRVADLSQLAS